MTNEDTDITPIDAELGRWGKMFRELEEIKNLCGKVDTRSLAIHQENASLSGRVATLESRVMYVPLAVAVIALACSLVAVSQASSARNISGAKPAAAAR